MNTTTQRKTGFTKLAKPLVAATALGLGGLALAITDAGTVIKNLATVTYTDNNGDSYTATSNEAEVVVAPVNRATLESDNQGGEAAPGQTVYFPHVLTNTGNSADTYTLSTADDDLTDAPGTATATAYTIYLDENGNGQPDAGEQVTGSVTLEPGEVANLIVAIDIPASATAGQIIDAKLEVTSADATAIITDLTPNADGGNNVGGLDDEVPGQTATNQDAVTVTLDEVLVSTKDSVLVGNTITYTLTVKNTGGSAATDVDIFDAIPANTTFNAASVTVSGLLTANGDTRYDDLTNVFIAPADLTAANITLTTDFDEPAGVDMDGDGVTGETGVSGFVVRDVSLPNNTTISVTYTVDISGAAAGSVFKNRFCAGEDIVAGASATTFSLAAEVADCSNQTIDEIPFTYSIDADDTDGNGAAGNNDGTDEDGTDDDVQFVDVAPIGSDVQFNNVITNSGTANDIVDLAIIADTFPANTVFTFWEANNLVPLTDNNNNGIPDTGVIGPGGSVTIVVRATLPQADLEGNTITEALLATGGTTLANNTPGTSTITLANGELFLDVDGDGDHDQAGESDAGENGTANDTVQGNGAQDFNITDTSSSLENDEIFMAVLKATSSEDASQIDYKIEALGAISVAVVDLANSATAAGFDDGGTVDAHAVVVATPIMIFGNDDADDNAGVGNGAVSGNSNPDGAPATNDGAVTIGQTVTFPLFIANEGGNLDAYQLSASSVAGLSVVFKNTAGDIITATPALSSGETYSYDAEVTVGESSAAGTREITFTVTSPTTGATNSKLDAIVVAVNCEVGITPATLQQIQAGGNVDYVHTFTNNSNVTDTYTITVASSDAAWSSLLVTISDDSGTFAADAVIASGGSVSLAPGQSITFINRIFAPASAISGQTEVSTITVSPSGACGDVTTEDVANVIVGQVRLDKTSAIDNDCACDETVFNRVGVDAADATDQVFPGECVQWQLVATNEGDEAVSSAVIRDSVTEFSVIHASGTYDGSLPGGPSTGLPTADQFQVCVGAGCTLAAVTSGGGAGTNGGSVTFANPSIEFTVGALNPGESATAQFCVQVQ